MLGACRRRGTPVQSRPRRLQYRDGADHSTFPYPSLYLIEIHFHTNFLGKYMEFYKMDLNIVNCCNAAKSTQISQNYLIIKQTRGGAFVYVLNDGHLISVGFLFNYYFL